MQAGCSNTETAQCGSRVIISNPLSCHVQVVIIDVGIHGHSVANHLAREGWGDLVLLGRRQKTSGTN